MTGAGGATLRPLRPESGRNDLRLLVQMPFFFIMLPALGKGEAQARSASQIDQHHVVHGVSEEAAAEGSEFRHRIGNEEARPNR